MRERSYRGRVTEKYLKESPLVGDLIADKYISLKNDNYLHKD